MWTYIHTYLRIHKSQQIKTKTYAQLDESESKCKQSSSFSAHLVTISIQF